MQIDRAQALATTEKVENKKVRLGDRAVAPGGVSALKQALRAMTSDDLLELAELTARDRTGAADYALVSIVPLGPTEPQTRKAGLFAGRQVIVGDLVVEGGALTVTGSTLVTGNLKANAVSVAETGALVIGGSLDARLASGDGWLWVRGDANVQLALGYLPAGEFRVGKKLSATLGLMSNHKSVVGENATQQWFDLPRVEPEDERYLSLLELLDERAIVPQDAKPDLGLHRIDFRALARLAALGQPLFRPKGKPRAEPAKTTANTTANQTKPTKPTKPAVKVTKPKAKSNPHAKVTPTRTKPKPKPGK
jgi:hypothetical protein